LIVSAAEKIGNNSPAARPEFIDLSLNASSSGIEQGMMSWL